MTLSHTWIKLSTVKGRYIYLLIVWFGWVNKHFLQYIVKVIPDFETLFNSLDQNPRSDRSSLCSKHSGQGEQANCGRKKFGREQNVNGVTSPSYPSSFCFCPNYLRTAGFKLFVQGNTCYACNFQMWDWAVRSCMCCYFSYALLCISVVSSLVVSYTNVNLTVNSTNLICVSLTGQPRYGVPVPMGRSLDGILWHSRLRRRWEERRVMLCLMTLQIVRLCFQLGLYRCCDFLCNSVSMLWSRDGAMVRLLNSH